MQNNTPSMVLVIEDDNSIAMLLEFMLKREGFEVMLAHDGLQAEQLIDGLQSPPALVLLDVMLPYVDGIQLLQKIRAKLDWQNVPVIMLTGKSLVDDVVRAFKLGANDYMVKPIHPAELLARIKRFILLSETQKSQNGEIKR